MILSLDFSFTNIGWAIYSANKSDGSGDLLRHGAFENPKVVKKTQSDLIYRCTLTREFLNLILSSYPIDSTITELPFGSRGIDSAVAMGAVFANYSYMKEIRSSITHYLITPGQMKKFIGSLSNHISPKERAREACLSLEGLTIDNEHSADAICIYHTWLNMNPKTRTVSR